MHLTRIRVRNFRSLWSEGSGPSIELNLGKGVNYLAGPNNCGKSNILRAIALAMGKGRPQDYSRRHDKPKQLTWAYTTITLDFKLSQKYGPERTLLRYAKEYEESVPGVRGPLFFEDRKVRYFVQYQAAKGRNPTRLEYFQAAGAGSRRGNEDALRRTLKQFRKAIRFVHVRSGEDLASLLERGFREVLRSVVEERFSGQFQMAEKQRRKYTQELRKGLLEPLSEHVRSEIGDFVPEIRDVELLPEVASLEDTLSRASFYLTDEAKTVLESKGTGVRGAVLLTVMGFIAKSSRRSVVFAIEEPEAFLHPASQVNLAKDLSEFADRRDVTVLITTHSPFLLSSDSSATVFPLSKTHAGQTLVLGHESLDPVEQGLEILTQNSAFRRSINHATTWGAEALGVMVVEGETDSLYLDLAVRKCKKNELKKGIEILACQGAMDVVRNAVFLKEFFGREKPVFALLDDDQEGNEAYKILTARLGFQGSTETAKYSNWVQKGGRDVEAEDLFPVDMIREFISEEGESCLSETAKRYSTEGYHYGLTGVGKEKFILWIESNGAARHFGKWLDVLKHVRKAFRTRSRETAS